MIVKMIKNLLSLLTLLRLRHSLSEYRCGEGSQVSYWRVRPSGNNKLVIGSSSMIETKIVYERLGASVAIGDRTFIGCGIFSVAQQIEIGSDVMIAWGVTVSDHNSHSLFFSQRSNDVTDWIAGKKDWSGVKIAPVKVMDKVWLGFNSIILKGVTIGEGAIVGAGSVVTKDVPPWTIVAGNPARVIREIPENER